MNTHVPRESRRGADRKVIGSGIRGWCRCCAPLLLLALTGCFTFRPVEAGSPEPGERVRAHLYAEAAREISQRVGQPITTVDGEILFSDPDSLRMEVGWRGLYAGTPFEARRDTLTFLQQEILLLEKRELSTERSAVVGLGFVALVVGIFQWLDLGGGAEGTPDPGPPEV